MSPFTSDRARSLFSSAACAYLLAVLGLLGTAAARADEDADPVISTGRPSVTDSSVVVPKGAVQIENGLLITDTGAQHVVDLPESTVRYGLLRKTEVRLGLPDYFGTISGRRDQASGWSDINIGLNQQLGPVAGTDFSIIGILSMPTGGSAVTSGGYDPGIELPWSRSIATHWTIGGQIANFWPTVNGTHISTAEVVGFVDRQFTSSWDCFLEYALDLPRGSDSRQLLHVGTSFKFSPRSQIDFHVGHGLTRDAPNSIIGIGYSILFLPT